MKDKDKKLKILFVAAELNPLAKVGGLADVIGSLPKALKKMGHDVRIVIPKYGIINNEKYKLRKIKSNINIPFENNLEKINIYQTNLPSSTVPIYLIDHLKYLGKNGVYVSPDASSDGSITEAHRFTFFTRVILEIFNKVGWTPDILHCHDWHVGMLAPLVKLLKKKIPTLFTIHNLAYQGVYKAESVQAMLNSKKIKIQSLPTIKQKLKNNDYLNYLEQSILNADLINTVSPNYAKEILTKDFGCGQEKNLKKRKKDLSGILNGIDIERFDPQKDPDIPFKYSIEDLSNKQKDKKALLQECRLQANKNLPLIGVVGRLTEQKGFDILLPIMKDLLKTKIQFVLLGTGDKKYEREFKKLNKYYKNFFAKLDFDAPLAQRIYAGSDIFLMPSRFEPCGLGQMISMRYGTLPVVRATGGLKDTVIDFKQKDGTGFVFKNYKPEELLKTITRAINSFNNQKNKWLKVQKRAMAQDFSWTNSAKKYLKLYNKLINIK
jgi:starch synthase